jgi:hypothetical protein
MRKHWDNSAFLLFCTIHMICYLTIKLTKFVYNIWLSQKDVTLLYTTGEHTVRHDFVAVETFISLRQKVLRYSSKWQELSGQSCCRSIHNSVIMHAQRKNIVERLVYIQVCCLKHMDRYLLGFEVLTAVSTKMAVFCIVAPCSLVVYQRLMEAARTSQMLVNFYQTTRCYNPEDSHLDTFYFIQFELVLL